MCVQPVPDVSRSGDNDGLGASLGYRDNGLCRQVCHGHHQSSHCSAATANSTVQEEGLYLNYFITY